MKIESWQIESKEHAGKNKDGKPVLYVATKGGLHIFFTKDRDDNIVSIAAAPLKSIAQWMAEQKDPDIKWDKDFLSGSGSSKLSKSHAEWFQKLRKTILSPLKNDIAKSDKNDLYLIYDTYKKNITLADKQGVFDLYENNEIDSYCVIRNSSLSEPPYILKTHPDFKELYEKK